MGVFQTTLVVNHWEEVQHRQLRSANRTYRQQAADAAMAFARQQNAINFGFGDFAVQNYPAGAAIPGTPIRQTIAIRQEAIEKARKLLLACLSDEQRSMFEATGHFEVVTQSGTRYRITRGWSGNVLLITNGKPAARFCIHPREYVPEEDNMLAQKLLLETDERTFLSTANRSAA